MQLSLSLFCLCIIMQLLGSEADFDIPQTILSEKFVTGSIYPRIRSPRGEGVCWCAALDLSTSPSSSNQRPPMMRLIAKFLGATFPPLQPLQTIARGKSRYSTFR
ncbi:unnamed protein product [Protopolystoma xenopodis]|uniref:Uncharacterized protein n=1 Tax=Protopolystoma xenopodis TaxID=117903 RepID=A0A448X3G5_9PLAT|nr:unnamed protein product [Protopolystoma xenopodis]